jgi:hypothetical protein
MRVDPGKRTKRYRPTAASVTSVTASHVSHYAQSCDTSTEAPGGGEEVSQNLDSSDICDIVTVATLPTEKPEVPPPAGDTFVDERRYRIDDVLTEPPSYDVVSWTVNEGERVESEHATRAAALAAYARLTGVVPGSAGYSIDQARYPDGQEIWRLWDDALDQVAGIYETEAEAKVAAQRVRVFVPTDDWQEVPDGAALPPGCEVRMDFESGKNYARLMPQETH